MSLILADMATRKFDQYLKVVLVGPTLSGKTLFCERFTKEQYTGHSRPTIDADFSAKTVEIDGRKIKLQIWDTNGQIRSRPTLQSFCRDADGLLYIFGVDISDQLQDVYESHKFLNSRGLASVPIVLVGSRCDIPDRKITREKAETFSGKSLKCSAPPDTFCWSLYNLQKLAKELDAPYFEVSALNGTNVKEAFMKLIALMLNKTSRGGSDSGSEFEEHKYRPNTDIFLKAMKEGTEEVFEMRLMTAGHHGVGKTTVTKGLLKDKIKKDIDSTDGIDIYVGWADIDLEKKQWVFGNKKRGRSLDVHRKIANVLETVQKEQNQNASENDCKIQLCEIKKQKVSESLWSKFTSLFSKSKFTDQESKGKTPSFKTESSGDMSRKELVTIEDLLTRAMEYAAEEKTKNVAPVQIWDFGGQVVFYSTHQTFLSSRCIYLLVFDISKGLKERIKDKDLYVGGQLEPEVIEFLIFWINSIITYARSRHHGFPKIILVGTHLDQIPVKDREKKVIDVFSEIQSIFVGHPAYDHLVIDPDLCFNAQDIEDFGFVILRKKLLAIAETQPHWGEKRPTSWLSLEETLNNMRLSGTKILPFSQVDLINRVDPVHVMELQELEAFLEFQHSLGNLFFFPEKNLRENVIIDPSWLIDALKSVVTAERFFRGCVLKEAVWTKLSTTGLISYDTIEELWHKEEYKEFGKNINHLIRVFERLDLLVKPKMYADNGEEEYISDFFLPAMIHQTVPSEIECASVPVLRSTSLLISFRGNFLPHAVVHRLIASALNLWPVLRTVKGNVLYSGFCGLRLDNFHRLHILQHRNQIFLHVSHIRDSRGISRELCKGIRLFAVNTLSRIVQTYMAVEGKSEFKESDDDDIFQVQIPCCSQHLDCIVDLKEGLPSAPSCEHHGNLKRQINNWIYDEVTNIEKDGNECDAECQGLDDSVMQRCPTDQDLGRISRNLISSPEILGVALEVPIEVIDETRCNPIYGKHEQTFHILYHWRKQGSGTTFTELAEALSLTQDNNSHVLCKIYKAQQRIQEDFLKERMFDHPSSEVLNSLADRITPSQAFHLGIELGLSPVTIEDVRCNHPNNSLRQKRQMLILWKEYSDLKPTLGILAAALDEVRIYSCVLKDIILVPLVEDEV